jgi:hypothetical protein
MSSRIPGLLYPVNHRAARQLFSADSRASFFLEIVLRLNFGKNNLYANYRRARGKLFPPTLPR